MSRIRIAIHGAAGRMGLRLVALTAADDQLELVAAVDAFREAAKVDPDDARVRVYLTEVEANLALRRELRAAPRQPVTPIPENSSGAEGASRGPLIAERFQELLAAIEEQDVRYQNAKALSSFRPVRRWDPEAPGPRLARGIRAAAREGLGLAGPRRERLPHTLRTNAPPG